MSGLALTLPRLRLLRAIAAGQVRSEAGQAWDASAGELQVTRRVAAMVEEGWATLTERTDKADRPLYGLTRVGALRLANAKAAKP